MRWCSECLGRSGRERGQPGLGRSAPERNSPHSLRTTLLCVVRITDDDHRQRAGSSPGEGSPWAEREGLAGSPERRTWTITRPPELVASRAGDLTPWCAGGSWHDSTGGPASLWADSGRSPAGQGEADIGPGRLSLGWHAGVVIRSRCHGAWNALHAVTLFARRAEISSEAMLQLYRVAPVSKEKEIVFEAKDPPSLTTDLAAALAQLVRAALARRAERPEKAA